MRRRRLLQWMRSEGAFRRRGSALPDLSLNRSGRGEEKAQDQAGDYYRCSSWKVATHWRRS